MHKYAIRKLLGIPEYKVTEIISITETEMHIRIEPYKRKKGICSKCGKEHRRGIHSSYWSGAIRDLDICGRKVFLHILKRRYRCDCDSKPHIEKTVWLKRYARVTQRFATQVNRLTAITTNQEAGWYLELDDEVVYRIDKEILEEKFAELLVPAPAAVNMSVDEVSYRKYHRYLTNVIDIDRKLVIWNEKGRKAEILDKYYESIGLEACERIESVAMDGARTYIASSNRYAVNALIVYDKFHVVQKLNKAVDKVRLMELRKARKEDNKDLIELTNCRQRFILLKNKKRLTERQTKYLDRLCELNKPIYKAMLLKESFLQIYESKSGKKAKKILKRWIREARESGLESFKELADSFRRKKRYILNWFTKRISSSISEGFNNKIKRLKRWPMDTKT